MQVTIRVFKINFLKIQTLVNKFVLRTVRSYKKLSLKLNINVHNAKYQAILSDSVSCRTFCNVFSFTDGLFDFARDFARSTGTRVLSLLTGNDLF